MLPLLLLLLLLLPTLALAQGTEQPGAYSVVVSTCTIDEHDQPILTIGSTDVTRVSFWKPRRLRPGRKEGMALRSHP